MKSVLNSPKIYIRHGSISHLVSSLPFPFCWKIGLSKYLVTNQEMIIESNDLGIQNNANAFKNPDPLLLSGYFTFDT